MGYQEQLARAIAAVRELRDALRPISHKVDPSEIVVACMSPRELAKALVKLADEFRHNAERRRKERRASDA